MARPPLKPNSAIAFGSQMTTRPAAAPAPSAEQSLTIRKRRAYSSVPDDILTDGRLSARARVILAWMIGRPEGWELRVGHLQSVFQLSKEQWRAARRELEAAGYYRQTQSRLSNGQVDWKREVWDVPIETHPPTAPGAVKPHYGAPSAGRPWYGPPGDIAVNDYKQVEEAAVNAGAEVVPLPHPQKHPRSLHNVRVWTAEDAARVSTLVASHGAEAIEAIAQRLATKDGRLPLPSMVEDAVAEHSRCTARKESLERQMRERQSTDAVITRNPEKVAAALRAAGLQPRHSISLTNEIQQTDD